MTRISPRFVVPALVIVASLSGCLDDARVTAPAKAPASAMRANQANDAAVKPVDFSWYPLEVGNRWTSHKRTSQKLFEPGKPPTTLFEWNEQTVSEIQCEQVLFGVRSAWERRTVTRPTDTIVGVFQWKQDHEGLWRWLGGGPPSGCQSDSFPVVATPRSVVSAQEIEREQTATALMNHPHRSEIVAAVARMENRRKPIEEDPRRWALILRYPLHVGQTWGSSSGTYTVEAHEILVTPFGRVPAWRIRVDSDFYDSDDWSYEWVSHLGILKKQTHQQWEFSLADGETIRSEWDETMIVDSVEIPGSR